MQARRVFIALMLVAAARAVRMPEVQDSTGQDANSAVGQSQGKRTLTSQLDVKDGAQETEGAAAEVVPAEGATGEECEEALQDGMITLEEIRRAVIPPQHLIALAIKALKNTLENTEGFYGFIRDKVLKDIQNQINMQKELEMKITLDGYRAQILHLQTILGISDHWTMEDVHNVLDGNGDPEFIAEMNNADISQLFLTDLNLLYHAVNNDKSTFVLRAPGDIVTALSHFCEYATTQLYVTQIMIDVAVHELNTAAASSYRTQYMTNAGYNYRYLQFSIGKTLDSMDTVRGSYPSQYLRRSQYYSDEKKYLLEVFSVQQFLDASTGTENSFDESVYLRQGDVVAFKRNFATSKHNEWMGCYNGGGNCGTATCPGADEPFENLSLLPCLGEIFQIYGEKDGYIYNEDVVAVNYNDGQTKGNTWWWVAIPKYTPDTRSCPGSTYTQAQPFDPTCEYERMRIWTPDRTSREPIQDRDLIFLERQSDGKYLDLGASASMYRLYRNGSVYKGVAYWTE